MNGPQEQPDPRPGAPGHGSPPATAAPVDAERDPGLQPPSPPPAPEGVGGRHGDPVATVDDVPRSGLLNDVVGLRTQWQQVQGDFVDAPRRAVHEASLLVEQTLERGPREPFESARKRDGID